MATSKNIAASAVVHTGKCAVSAVVLTAGSDAATVAIADAVAGGGTTVLYVGQPTASTPIAVALPEPRVFNTGVYATISGTSPNVTVVYTPLP